MLAEEIVRGGFLPRAHWADYFDASINRLAAWVIGTRAMSKAMMMAMLEPTRCFGNWSRPAITPPDSRCWKSSRRCRSGRCGTNTAKPTNVPGGSCVARTGQEIRDGRAVEASVKRALRLVALGFRRPWWNSCTASSTRRIGRAVGRTAQWASFRCFRGFRQGLLRRAAEAIDRGALPAQNESRSVGASTSAERAAPTTTIDSHTAIHRPLSAWCGRRHAKGDPHARDVRSVCRFPAQFGTAT